MIISNRSPSFDWEAAGRELGETLDAYHAIVVIGADATVTGRVAIGIARGQSTRRRVAVGDLFAESPPIQALVTTDDPHGIVDSFIYGVSLTKIAHPVPGAGQLFVMQSGTESPDYEDILPNSRWHRLTAGFGEVGALLVIAAPANAPHIEQFVAAFDGAILVGEVVPRQLPVSRVITTVREPGARAAAPEVGPSQPARAVPTAELDQPAAPEISTRWSRRRMAAVAGVVLTLVLAATGAWLAYRPLVKSGRPRVGPKPDTTKGLTNVLAAARPDTAIRDSGADSTVAAGIVRMPAIKNPGDSAVAALFGVQLITANTQTGAILKLQRDGKKLPAATFAPVVIQGVRWFKVISGAYANRSQADSLLADLRRRKLVDDSSGSIVRVPFAFLIDSSVPATAVAGMVATYADRGQPVYALRQPDGTAWLLAGAFESLEQSSLYAETLRASGIAPMLVYRKGRTF